MLIGDELVRGAYLIDWRWRTDRQRSAGGVTIIYTGIRSGGIGRAEEGPELRAPDRLRSTSSWRTRRANLQIIANYHRLRSVTAIGGDVG
ncbi:hypothetical protein RR48_08861 [Papilio machaon]|uniref:Uncharacterized protein n=1 Tax=Papilio machaon TaxID=76193 RepID=A0A194QWS3_PAPMA|nr:hypothetical protein RR48_08861 [Papilio machaon]